MRRKDSLLAISRPFSAVGLRLADWQQGRRGRWWLVTAWLAVGLAFPVWGQPPPESSSPAADAGVAPPADTSTPYWSRDVVLRNVDAQRVVTQLEALGVEVPIALAGTASLEATVWIPYRDLLTPTKYRLEATLTSPQLTIDAVRLADATVQFRYEQGRLALSNLRGTLLDDGGAPAGKLTGTGLAQLIPLEGVTLELGVEAVDLRTLARDLAELPTLPRGLFSGQVRLVQPDLRTAGRLENWSAEGTLEVAGFALESDRMWDLEIETLRYRDGLLRAEGMTARQRLPEPRETVGAIVGTAEAQLIPAGEVRLEATAREVILTHALASLDLPLMLRGTASGTIDLRHPDWQQVDDASRWQGEATGSVVDFRYRDFPVADQRVDLEAERLRLAAGQIELSGLSARQMPAGKTSPTALVAGSGSAQLFPAGPLEVDLRVERIDLAELPQGSLDPAAVVPAALVSADWGGVASGRLQASHPQLDRVGDWRGWRGQASLHVAALTADGRPPVDLDLPQLRLDAEGLTLAAGKLSGADWQTSLAGRYEAADPQAFRLTAATQTMPLVWLYAWVSGQESPPESDGTLAFELTAKGQAASGSWQVDGQLAVADGHLAGLKIDAIDHRVNVDATRFVLQPRDSQTRGAEEPKRLASLRLGRVEAAYHTSPETFHLDRFRAELLGGAVEGKASLALTTAADVDAQKGEKQAAAPRHHAQVAWTDLGFAGKLAAAGAPQRLQGISQGEADWSAAAGSLADPRKHQIDARIELASLSLAGTLLGDLTVDLENRDANWQGTLEGQLWDGRVQGNVTADLAAATAWSALPTAPLAGNVQVAGADVRRFFALWQSAQQAEKWGGQGRLDWRFRAGEEGASPGRENEGEEDTGAGRGIAEAEPDAANRWSGEGEFAVSDLTYGGRLVSRQLSLQVTQSGDVLRVPQLVGEFAGGRLAASGSWRLAGTSPGMTFLLRGVDVNRAALIVSPTIAAEWKGIASGRIQIAGERVLRGSGRLEVRRLGIHGLQLGTMRAGIDGQLDVATQQWRVRFRDMAGAVARGRIRGRASLRSSPGQWGRVNLESRWELANVDFEEVLGDFQTVGSRLGRGKLTGTLTLGGERIRSVDDLEGKLTGRLGGTEATAVPGLPAVQNQLGVLSLRNTRFEAGKIDATLRRGIFRIQAFGLASDALRVWAEGQIALASGRADLNAVVATGNFEQANVTLLTLAQQFALDATLPVGAIVRINEALSDRVIFLRLTGTLARPHVRVRVGETLGRNAAIFFFRSLTNGLVAAPALEDAR